MKKLIDSILSSVGFVETLAGRACFPGSSRCLSGETTPNYASVHCSVAFSDTPCQYEWVLWQLKVETCL